MSDLRDNRGNFLSPEAARLAEAFGRNRTTPTPPLSPAPSEVRFVRMDTNAQPGKGFCPPLLRPTTGCECRELAAAGRLWRAGLLAECPKRHIKPATAKLTLILIGKT